MNLSAQPLIRRVLAAAVAAATAALGAVVLGEYEFRGWLPFVAGTLFGLLVGELVVSVSGRRGLAEAVVAAAAAGGGLAWGAWIASSEGVEPWPVLVWPAIALGVATAALRSLPRRSAAPAGGGAR